MDHIESLLSVYDFGTAHNILSLYGAFSCVYAMQLISYEGEDEADPTALQWLTRAGYAILALAMLYSFMVWQPTANPFRPLLAVLLAIDLLVTVRIVTVHVATSRAKKEIGELRRCWGGMPHLPRLRIFARYHRLVHR